MFYELNVLCAPVLWSPVHKIAHLSPIVYYWEFKFNVLVHLFFVPLGRVAQHMQQ